MTPDRSLVVRRPDELIAIVPYLLGYHPSDSLAVVGLAGKRVEFAVCHNLPPPDWTVEEARASAASVAAAIARQGAKDLVVIGYGRPAPVMAALAQCGEALNQKNLSVLDAIGVYEGRWRSLVCADDQCCPPEGRPCLPADSVIAAEATFRGQVALPSREELIAQVAAVDGAERAEMGRATERARHRFTDLMADDLSAARLGQLVKQNGQAALRAAEKTYRNGGTLSPDETAWLSVLLVERSVQDYALNRTDPHEWRIRLWIDVLRRVDPAYVAPPACLLGITAWQAGRGALARVAVDRALAEEPQHRLAGLLHQVLAHGLPPHLMRSSRALRRSRRAR
ncbi:DUF4192 domain-containing protein [Actinoplanes awajinensis]|uniref:DUF4192 domain-containing protein n=1 Tax=Actinoplanes awajinensis subsp. mycoplanecinus TaxID=135947 RepID=A0A0X3UPV4_9ACTN|nr:DUF4192 domain-containing protein [Actinoplanes awajinensis]KUL34633.1 hypothetical protein ADL15_15160 [Actinoplanes awajinensis subsp. mycoplanecinus]